MSFILDALKKSEAERLRRDSPGFASVPDNAKPKPASRWGWVIVALIGVNLAVLAALIMNPARPPDAGAESAEPVLQAAPAVTQGAANPVQRDAALASAPAQTAPEPTAATWEAERLPVEHTPPADDLHSATVGDNYASFNELRAQGILQLPDLHLDIHVHSPEPAGRFVFVNMRKYKERARLDEGPVIREITPEGVILEYRGTAFLLPRE